MKNKDFTICKTVFGKKIRASVKKLDCGCHVLITGGDCTHIGAVTLIGQEMDEQTIERRNHRDSAVSRKWAGEIHSRTKEPVCICCGIHYDGISKEQIARIMESLDVMLADVVTRLSEAAPE